jgi:TPR repeat protein
VKVTFYTLGKCFFLSMMAVLFFASSLSALEGKTLYYETEEIELLQSLKLAEVINKASSGDAVSQYQLGSIYYLGIAEEKNEAEAVKWLQKAAGQGNSLACRKMGLLSHFGEIVGRNINDALRWYTKAQENGDADALLLMGIVYLYEFALSEDAIRWFKASVEAGNTLAYFLLAETKYTTGDTDGALSWYKFAAENGHQIANVRLGNIYYEKKNFERGVQWLNAKSISTDDEKISIETQIAVYRNIWGNFSKVADVNRKILLARQKVVVVSPEERKRIELAKKEKKVVKKSPASQVEKVKAADPVRSQEIKDGAADKVFDETRDYFKQIINGKEKAKKLLQKSHLSLQSHDWNEAIRTASEAIVIQPDYADAYNNRAWGYYEKGLLDESIEDCNKALQIDKNHFFAINNRGRAFQKKGDIPSALKDYDSACQKGLEEACENFKKITRLSPDKEIVFLLGKSREDLAKGNLDGAIEASTKLIALNVHTKEAYSKRCRAYVMKNMFDMAHSDCAEAILLDPDESINYINLGVVFEQEGDMKASLRNYRISCELKNKRGCLASERLVADKREADIIPLVLKQETPSKEQVEKESHAVPSSDPVVERVEESLPELNVVDLLEQSRQEFGKQDYDAVIYLSTQIIQVDSENVEAYSNRCGARSMMNLHQEAHDDCIKAIEINPDFSMGYNNLGWVFEQQGDVKEALVHYNISCQLENTLGCQNYQRLSDK